MNTSVAGGLNHSDDVDEQQWKKRIDKNEKIAEQSSPKEIMMLVTASYTAAIFSLSNQFCPQTVISYTIF